MTRYLRIQIVEGWRKTPKYTAHLLGLYTKAGYRATVLQEPMPRGFQSNGHVMLRPAAKSHVQRLFETSDAVHLLSGAGYALMGLDNHKIVITESTPVRLDATTLLHAAGLSKACQWPLVNRLAGVGTKCLGWHVAGPHFHDILRNHRSLLMLTADGDPIASSESYATLRLPHRAFIHGTHARLFRDNDFSVVTDFLASQSRTT
jgi:hypothetical protein